LADVDMRNDVDKIAGLGTEKRVTRFGMPDVKE
jgi:hypothetical protein